MSAAEYNITIEKYADYTRGFQAKQGGTVLDITGYTFTGSLKENYRSTEAVNFTTTILDAVQGTYMIEITDDVTATMDPGTWVYDIVMTDASGLKTRILEGKAFIKEGVTA